MRVDFTPALQIAGTGSYINPTLKRVEFMTAIYKNIQSAGLALLLLISTTIVSATVLEEVVVTAQKREQSIQDANLAVTAVHGDRLEDGLIENVGDLQTVAPGISAGDDFAFAKIFIRGIGLSTSFAGVDPSVALHNDGAVISQAYAQLGSYFDLERIEVLRGPQGTLYGRNATGGSINLITRKPTEELEGYGRVSYGNYDMLQLEGALSGPLTDGVLGRIAFKNLARNGYGENEVNGADIDDADKQSLRGHLQFNINEDIDLLLTAEYHNEDDSALGLKFVEFGNNIDSSFAPSPGAGGIASGRRNVASEADYRNDRDTWAVTATLNWQLNENYSIKSLTNYRELDVLLKQDLDISSNINDDIQNNATTSEHFSQELQLSYDGDRLRGLAAVYYFNEDFTNDNNIGFDRAADGLTTFVNLTGDIDIEATAVFAHITYDVTDQISLNAGGRYSYEKRSGVTTNDVLLLSRFGFAIDLIRSYSDRRSFNDFSPSVGIEWRPRDNILAYFTYSEGFKSGSFQSGQLVRILEPESIENYEFGIKGTYLEDRLQLNLAGFYYEITDLQVDRSIPSAGGGFITVFENAAAAEGKGVEVEMSWLVTNNFRLDGNVSYLDAEFEEYDAANPLFPSNGALVSLAGNSLRQSPEWSWNLRGEYEFPLVNGGSVVLGAEASFKDDQFYTEFNDAITGQNDYTLVNANIKYTSPNERLTINVWGKNITDEFVRSGIFFISTGRTVSASLLPPATVGVTVGYNF